jgi:cephalosporin hydroxylase
VGPDGIARSVAAWESMLPLYWRGFPCQQFAADMWRYAEVVHKLRPPWVLECGTAGGGTALFLADAMASAGGGLVISIDNDPRPAGVTHPRLTLIKGGTTADDTIGRVLDLTCGTRGLVLLDDDHSCAHVLAELDLYAPLADYLIVEDTLIGHLPQYPDNPRQAVEKWLPGHPEFTQDPEPVPTNHPGGWLRRVAG